eukprot:1146208-Pelagomonas_calceolata.AAC.1
MLVEVVSPAADQPESQAVGQFLVTLSPMETSFSSSETSIHFPFPCPFMCLPAAPAPPLATAEAVAVGSTPSRHGFNPGARGRTVHVYDL